uniref:Putative capsid morphogenesis protein n=1 Tax=viral metagenome TaxID=1070528 RepID=A0A6M3LV99_9ZZZZ
MTVQSDIDGIIDPLLATFSARRLTSIQGELVSIYVSGTAQMTKWAGLPFEGPPAKAATDFAKKRGAELVTKMDEETKRRLGNVISEGIKNKRGVPGIARDIRKTFTDMTKYRSELISRTETANALGEAFTDRGKGLGVTGKEWVTVGDDRVSLECQDNEAQGVIPFDQEFRSGHMTPPQHPACRCAAAPVML